MRADKVLKALDEAKAAYDFVTYDPIYEGIGSKLKKILVGLGLIASIYGAGVGNAHAFDLRDIDVGVQADIGSLNISQREGIHGNIEVQIPIIQSRINHEHNPQARAQLQTQLQGLQIVADLTAGEEGGDSNYNYDSRHGYSNTWRNPR